MDYKNYITEKRVSFNFKNIGSHKIYLIFPNLQYNLIFMEFLFVNFLLPLVDFLVRTAYIFWYVMWLHIIKAVCHVMLIECVEWETGR